MVGASGCCWQTTLLDMMMKMTEAVDLDLDEEGIRTSDSLDLEVNYLPPKKRFKLFRLDFRVLRFNLD